MLFVNGKARFLEELMPFPQVRIAVKAAHSIAGIRGPVYKADTRPRQNRAGLMVFHDDPLRCDTTRLLEKTQRLFLVVQDVGQQDIIERVVIMGNRFSVVGIDWYHALLPGVGFQPSGLKTTLPRKGPGKSPTPTTDIKQGLPRSQAATDQAEEGPLPPLIYRRMKLAEKALHSASVAPRDF